MINCPNCNELIGDQVSKCPFCKTVVSEEMRRNALEEKERANVAAEAEAMAKHAKRFGYGIAATVIMLLVTFGGARLAAVTNNPIFALIFLLFDLTITLVSIFVLRVPFCPYCELHMGRGSLFRDYCPRCGGKLR